MLQLIFAHPCAHALGRQKFAPAISALLPSMVVVASYLTFDLKFPTCLSLKIS